MSEQHPSRPADPAVEAAAAGRFIGKRKPPRKSKRRSRRPQQARAPPSEDVDAFSIPQSCSRHNISEAFFHKLRGVGLGPDTMKVMGRTLISREAAARWRRQREMAALAAHADIGTNEVQSNL